MRPFFICLGLAAALGCGGGSNSCPPATSFPGAPALTVSSQSGALQVAVRTSPQPLARGVNSVQYSVTEASGGPVTGLDVSVTPWMPDMGHGSSIDPTVLEEGNGVYVVSCVDLAMPGTWQLRTAFSGSVTDDATPTFQVQ